MHQSCENRENSQVLSIEIFLHWLPIESAVYSRHTNYRFKDNTTTLAIALHPASEGGKRRLIILLSVSCEEWDSVEIFMKLNKKIGTGMFLHNLTKCVYKNDSGDIFLTFRQVF